MEKYYRFAGVEVAIRIPEEWMYQDDRQLAPFRTARASDPLRLAYRPVAELSAPFGELTVLLPGLRIYREGEDYVRYIGAVEHGWETAYLRAEHRAGECHVQVKTNGDISRIGVRTVLNAMGVEHLVAQARGFVLHCAYIAYRDKAILFTAPSGTGKSTQAELWARYRQAEIVNGDRAVVRIQGGPVAAGIPFCGSSAYCENRTLPIAAVVYLSQAPETSIRRLRGTEAFRKLWEGVSVNAWNREDVEAVSDVMIRTVGEVPVFHMACTPDESAVTALEEVLRKSVKP